MSNSYSHYTNILYYINADNGLYKYDASISDLVRISADLTEMVPITRKINGKALSEDITLTPTDIGAAPAEHNHDNVYYRKSETYSKDEIRAKIPAFAEHYAFTIDNNEPVCKSKITYPSGVDNSNYIPAGLSDSGFSYGDWENAFFIKKLKIVMLNFDGTEAYEIDKNNYKKKVDGGDVGEEGNVMVAIPKIYYKVVDHGNGTATYHFSEIALDSDYKCWAHIGLDGEEKDYCYMSAYGAHYDGNKFRSLTGTRTNPSPDAQTQINRTVANNLDSAKQNWYIGVVVDRLLIQLLLLLIGKNTNTREQFGVGRTRAGFDGSALYNGTMDDKGLFWGDTGGLNGVKVFGIENFWGNIQRRIAGWISDHGTQKIKMTYGTQDGSATTGYNLTGDGYVNAPDVPVFTKNTYGWIKTMVCTKFGLFPDPTDISSGSASTYFASMADFDNDGIYYAYVGGYYNSRTDGSGFSVYMCASDGYVEGTTAGSLSYKKG